MQLLKDRILTDGVVKEGNILLFTAGENECDKAVVLTSDNIILSNQVGVPFESTAPVYSVIFGISELLSRVVYASITVTEAMYFFI